MKYLTLLSFIFLSACSSEEAKMENSTVYVKTGVEEPDDCKDLGVVTGATIKDGGPTDLYKKALRDIRRSAKALGANYLHLRRISSDSKFIVLTHKEMTPRNRV